MVILERDPGVMGAALMLEEGKAEMKGFFVCKTNNPPAVGILRDCEAAKVTGMILCGKGVGWWVCVKKIK